MASNNPSENTSTVIEQHDRYNPVTASGGRRASNCRSIVSMQSANIEGEPGYLVVHGVGGPVAHVIGVDNHQNDPSLIVVDNILMNNEDPPRTI